MRLRQGLGLRRPGRTAVIGCFVAIACGPVTAWATMTDATTREFTARSDRSVEGPVTDAVSREFTARNDRSVLWPEVDAVSREFTVRNDRSVRRPPLDAISREFTAWNRSPASIRPADAKIPAVLTLLPPRPNPSTGTAVFVLGLPRETTLSLKVYDAAGRRVTAVASGRRLAAGWHSLTIDGSHWPRGVYFYRLEADARSLRGKLLLAK